MMPPTRIGWPVRPVPPKPIVPGPVNPPVPPIPPGTPPVDPGPIVIYPSPPPGAPPPPVQTPLPQYQPGVWSDGCVLVRQQGGSLKTLVFRRGMLAAGDTTAIPDAIAGTQDWFNRLVLGPLGAAAVAVTEEPWPVKPNAQKASKEMSMDTELSISEKLDVLIAVAEQTAKDVASLKAAPVAAESDTGDHWAAAYALADEPAGLDVPLDVFSPERAALYGVFQRSVINGTRICVGPACVELARTLALSTPLDAAGERYLDLCVKYGVHRDVAIFALLTGLVDPYLPGFTARIERDVAALAGTYKPETLSDGTVINRFVRLDFEGAYKLLLPSGSGGQAGQGGN